MTNRISKLGIGTVQFGLDYGISNRVGKIPSKEVHNILQLASKAGVTLLDTAPQYGDSEQVLGSVLPKGHQFQIVTKTPDFKTNKIHQENGVTLKKTFHQSLENLSMKSFYSLMIHLSDDLLTPGGEYLFEAMEKLKSNGLVEKIGVSVYSAAQIDLIMDRFSIDLIQVPVNILDQRLIQSGHLKALKQAGVEIHARSIFLQGLLLMDLDVLPAYFSSIRQHLKEFHADCIRENISPVFVCLDFILNHPEIDRVITGVCSKKELGVILEATMMGKLSMEYAGYAWQDESIIDPSKWKTIS